MGNNYPEIRELLQQKVDYQARLNLLPYDGSPEIKEQGGKQYLYNAHGVLLLLACTVCVLRMNGLYIFSRRKSIANLQKFI